MEWPNTGDSGDPLDNQDEGIETGAQNESDEGQKGSPESGNTDLSFPEVSLDDLPGELRTVVQDYMKQIESGYKKHYTQKTTELAKIRKDSELLREQAALAQNLMADPAIRNYFNQKLAGQGQNYQSSMDDDGSGPDPQAELRAEIARLYQELRGVKAGREWDGLLRAYPDADQHREAIRDWYMANPDANLPVEKVYKFVKYEAQARNQEKIRLKPPVERPGGVPNADRNRNYKGKSFNDIVDGSLSELGIDRRRFLRGDLE